MRRRTNRGAGGGGADHSSEVPGDSFRRAAGGIYFFDADWADPAASILISVLILAGVWRLTKDTVMVLLEATPAGIDPDEVTTALTDMTGIRSIHHLHIWAIDSETTALTTHLEVDDGTDLHGAQELADSARSMLRERFDIAHATFEPGCHDCEFPEHEAITAPVSTRSPAQDPFG